MRLFGKGPEKMSGLAVSDFDDGGALDRQTEHWVWPPDRVDPKSIWFAVASETFYSSYFTLSDLDDYEGVSFGIEDRL